MSNDLENLLEIIDLFRNEPYYGAWFWESGELKRAIASGRGSTTDATAKQEGSMNQHYLRRGVFVILLGGMFLLGFVIGSVSQQSAQAQVPNLGGALGSAQELGSSIVEMQQHVDGLQKNLATLKKVQSALGGGK